MPPRKNNGKSKVNASKNPNRTAPPTINPDNQQAAPFNPPPPAARIPPPPAFIPDPTQQISTPPTIQIPILPNLSPSDQELSGDPYESISFTPSPNHLQTIYDRAGGSFQRPPRADFFEGLPDPTVGPSAPPPTHPVSSDPSSSVPAEVGASSNDNVAAMDTNGKVLMTVDEAGQFLPSLESSQLFKKAAKLCMKAFHPTWGKMPLAHKEMIFNEFKKHVTYDPAIEGDIRQAFERKGATRYKDAIHDMKKKSRRPLWCGEEVWEAFCRHWAAEETRRLAKINSENRNSPTGGSLYAGGSRSISFYKKKMEKEMGREPYPYETFKETRMRKDGKWVERRAELLYEGYVNEHVSQPSQASGSGSDQSTAASKPIDHVETWIEKSGGVKKGRVYGLGTTGKFKRSTSSSSSKKSQPTTEEYEALKMEVDRLREMQIQMAEENERRIAQMWATLSGGTPGASTSTQQVAPTNIGPEPDPTAARNEEDADSDTDDMID